MSKRITAVATRTGDYGTTAIGPGSRLLKSNPLITAIGEVDELNSTIGLAVAHASLITPPPPALEVFNEIHQALFDLGGELALQKPVLKPEQTERLDTTLAELNALLSPLTDFVFPKGHIAACHFHVARTVCRRAERALVAVMCQHILSSRPEALCYLNRLSDLLFVYARLLNQVTQQDEAIWDRPTAPVE